MQSDLQALIPGQRIFHVPSFTLESGHTLTNSPVAYKTWGTLNATGDNVMVICHALSGSADVEDWWSPLLGPGKAFDTDVFFVFCGNVLGSPYGTASPVTCDPETARPYGPTFPATTIRDDVRLHKIVLDTLGVKQVQFAIGGSMGGMQVLEWAFLGRDYVRNIVPIACSGRHSAWCISWGESQRQSIYSDPNYADGNYTADKPPASGLAAARMQALLTYRSRNSFESRFGRKVMSNGAAVTTTNNSSNTHNELPRSPSEHASLHHNEGHKLRFQSSPSTPTVTPLSTAAVPTSTTPTPSSPSYSSSSITTASQAVAPRVYSAQSYLRYQGDKFIRRFDANCYIHITRKLDTHDLSRDRGDYYDVLATIQQPTLVIGIETDGLFTIGEQRELADHIPQATLEVIQSPEGHDGFLLEFEQINNLIQTFIHTNAPAQLFQQAATTKKHSSTDFTSKPSVFGEAEDALLW
ncbi:homoserine O-acetyltransferase [Powellomyces hirtus]|uniref:Homoserine O-acetyltransferase n=1 Tax=Powellomyces hirtus TaxID=109895 RepID=A0A507DZ80_9FUNG|nr:homoserine O-acetyltransferase [Powellomyces hirtus]